MKPIDDIYNEILLSDLGMEVYFDEFGVCYNSSGKIVRNPNLKKTKVLDKKTVTEEEYRAEVQNVQMLFLDVYRNCGYVAKKACDTIGIERAVYMNWVKNDEVFFKVIKSLESEYKFYLEDKLKEHIENNNFDALKMELQCKMSDVYNPNNLSINKERQSLIVSFE